MTIKYPYSKFLLPAGFLPILAPIVIFQYYEELRTGKFSKTNSIACGFEYFYMVDQDPELVNQSPIGGKIVGVHGPWTQMGKTFTPEDFVISNLTSKTRVSTNLKESAEKTLNFAKAVGAKYTVFHTVDLDPLQPEKFVKFLVSLGKSLKIKIYLEYDLKKGNLDPWYYNPLALYQKFKQPIVYDMATVDWNGENSLKEWQKLPKNAVAHIHLNEYQKWFGKDQGIMKSYFSQQLLTEIKNSGYNGYFTFEVGPIQNKTDKIIAGFYLLSCLMGITTVFPKISELYAGKSQKNLYESVIFTAKYLI